jgi:DNA-directed RNA polymerase specialized sigma24 family protein
MFEELREMNNEIRKKQEKIAELRALAVSMTKPYDSDRVQTSPSDRLSNIMCRIIILENELDGMIDDYADEKQRIKRLIFQVEREEWQDILYIHYIEQKSFSEIAKHMGISLNAVKTLNNRALKCLRGLDETGSL